MNIYHRFEVNAKRSCYDNHRNQAAPLGLESFEAEGVEPVFLDKDQAINYAENRASFRSGEIRILDSDGTIENVIPFSDSNRRI